MAPADRRLGTAFTCQTHLDVGADGVRLELAGELDLATVPVVREAIDGAEARAGQIVTVDLRGLTFMDSSGLHLLLHATDRMTAAGLRLVIVQGNATIRRLFEITGTATRLPLVDAA